MRKGGKLANDIHWNTDWFMGIIITAYCNPYIISWVVWFWWLLKCFFLLMSWDSCYYISHSSHGGLVCLQKRGTIFMGNVFKCTNSWIPWVQYLVGELWWVLLRRCVHLPQGSGLKFTQTSSKLPPSGYALGFGKRKWGAKTMVERQESPAMILEWFFRKETGKHPHDNLNKVEILCLSLGTCKKILLMTQDFP